MRRKLAALLAAVLLLALCACAAGQRSQEEGLRLWFASALTDESGWTGAAQAVSTAAYSGEETVGGMLAAEILTSLFALLLLLFQTPVFAPPSLFVMRKNLEKLMEIALPISSSRFSLGIFQSMEAVLIPLRLRYFGYSLSEAYSHYGILTGMALPLVLFPSAVTGAVSMLLIPEISEADTLNDRQAILRTARSTVAGCLYLGIFCTGGFFLFGKELGLFLFQSEEAGSYIRILGWICPFLYLGTTLSSILNSLGKTTAVFFQNLLGILIRIALCHCHLGNGIVLI